MASRNSRHQEIMQLVAQAMGNTNIIAQLAGKKFGAQRRVNYLVFANTAATIAMVGRMFGWW